MAQREIGLAAGEPPTTRGYPPSVFAMLPKLVERAGRASRGSITAFYSVLVEGDDTNEPVSDAVRGLLDGHVILSRRLAVAGALPGHRRAGEHQPADHRPGQPPSSSSAAQTVRELLAAYRDHEDLISIGAYRSGANPTVDAAIAMRDEINTLPAASRGRRLVGRSRPARSSSNWPSGAPQPASRFAPPAITKPQHQIPSNR